LLRKKFFEGFLAKAGYSFSSIGEGGLNHLPVIRVDEVEKNKENK